MKKQYINPSMTIMHVETISMIATSGDPVTFTGTGGGEVKVQNTDASGDAMGHGFNIWDDEE